MWRCVITLLRKTVFQIIKVKWWKRDWKDFLALVEFCKVWKLFKRLLTWLHWYLWKKRELICDDWMLKDNWRKVTTMTDEFSIVPLYLPTNLTLPWREILPIPSVQISFQSILLFFCFKEKLKFQWAVFAIIEVNW